MTMRYENGRLLIGDIGVRMQFFSEQMSAVMPDLGQYEFVDFRSGLAVRHGGGGRSTLSAATIAAAAALEAEIVASDHYRERQAEHGAERDRLERKARAVAAIKNAGFASVEEAVAAMLAAAALNQSEIDRLLAFAGTSSPNAVADVTAAPVPTKPRRRKSTGGDA